MEEEKNRRRYTDDNDDDNNDEDKPKSDVQPADTKYDNLRKDIGEIQHENNIRSHGKLFLCINVNFERKNGNAFL